MPSPGAAADSDQPDAVSPAGNGRSDTAVPTSAGRPDAALQSTTKPADAKAQGAAAKLRPASKPTGSTPSRAPLYLLALIILAGLAALLYHDAQQQKAITALHDDYLQLQQQRDALDAQVATLQQARASLEQNQQALLDADQTSQSTQSRRFESLDRELAALRTRIGSDTGQTADSTWRLMEAESLLRLAQQRLLLAGDVRPALGLSLAADELLRRIDDGAVFNVREALGRDIAALQGVREVDIPGLYARLGGAIAQVDTLAVQPEGDAPDFRVQAQEAGDASSSWWRAALAGFGQYFVVRHDVDTPVAQLTSEQAWVVKEQVQLQLEEARVALLRGQETLYLSALEAASAGVAQWLQGEGKPALLSELQALHTSAMRTELPTADAGLQALRALQEQRDAAP
ncbi:MAG TPA: uroporphyrinogen-III C-methyltransferase [Hyphomicrobiales bacterium]|nr:uroporphyrinogen-III C-methyltransferase [Hyphomicrobiales bacterium]